MRKYPKRRSNPSTKQMGTRGWSGGLQQISHPSAIKDNELSESRNVRYQANGVVEKRQGSLSLGASEGDKINSLQGVYDVGGNDYFVRISDSGKAQYYNFNTEIWTDITGSPTFSDTYTTILQAYGFVYFLNAVDTMTKWDGTSWLTFTAIANPTDPPSVSKTGSDDDGVTYYYRYVWYNDVGNTIASTSGSVTNCPWDFSTTTYAEATLPTAPAGAKFTGIFRGTIEGEEVYLSKVPASQTTFFDRGYEFPDDLFAVPENNTSGGFHFKFADIYRSTLIGVTTEMGEHTLVFSAGGDKFDSFGRADGGGFYAWRKDDGDPITGVRGFTLSNEDGLYVTKRSKIGVFHFDEAGGSVRDINIGVGIVSHLSLHPAGNNLRGWGEDGAVSIQNEANYANIIRTQVFSVKADNIAKSITFTDINKISGAYYDGLSLFGLPTGDEGAGNNTCLVYDEKFASWSEWRGLNPAIFATFIGPNNQRKLYFGSSKSGNVVEMFKGKDDDGEPVVFKITTKQFDDDKPYAYKKFRRIIYIFGNVSGNSTLIRIFEDGVRSQIPLAVSANRGYAGIGYDVIGESVIGESEGTFEPDTSGLIPKYADLNNKDLFSVQTTIENDGLSDEISVVGVYILFSDSNKPLPSTTKLQRTSG